MTELEATAKALEEMGVEIHTPLDINLALEDMAADDADKLGRRVDELLAQ